MYDEYWRLVDYSYQQDKRKTEICRLLMGNLDQLAPKVDWDVRPRLHPVYYLTTSDEFLVYATVSGKCFTHYFYLNLSGVKFEDMGLTVLAERMVKELVLAVGRHECGVEKAN